MVDISVVIITLNEEDNIARCLKSVKNIASEIVIIDSFSTDSTQQIAEEFSARFIKHDWLGYAETKNLGNQLATFDWILSIDADEELNTTLSKDIQSQLSNPSHIAYSFKRIPFYCGYRVNYTSWNPDIKIRLFNKHHARWEGKFVHEKLTLSDQYYQIGLLKGECYHYTMNNLDEHLNTIQRYTNLQADELIQSNKHINYYHLLLKPLFEFIFSFFFKLGLLDGYIGFTISVMNAYSKYLKYAKAHMRINLKD